MSEIKGKLGLHYLIFFCFILKVNLLSGYISLGVSGCTSKEKCLALFTLSHTYWRPDGVLHTSKISLSVI